MIIWLTRNEYVFKEVIISSPEVLMRKLIALLQIWSALSKGEAMAKILDYATDLKNRITPRTPTGVAYGKLLGGVRVAI